MSELDEINPKVQKLTIGIMDSYEISIYPLSVGDELELLNLISDGLKQASENKDGSLPNSIIDAIRSNIPTFISLVTDENEWKELCDDGTPIIKKMTNKQLNKLIEMVYEENFGGDVGKNLQRLMGSLIAAADSILKVTKPTEPNQPEIQPQK